MNRLTSLALPLPPAAAARASALKLACVVAFLGALAAPAFAEDFGEFGETTVIIEINASDGDVGFHSLMDGDAWSWGRITDPMGQKIVTAKASGAMADQGLTEFFFESAEPLCEPDEEEPDDPVLTLGEFLMRFAEGTYKFRAFTLDGDKLKGTAELTYDIPAAADISLTEDMEMAVDAVVIAWMPGDDLGDSCHDQALIDDGIIPDHADVPVVAWEVVVEPEDEDAATPTRKFTAHLPPGQTSVAVPEGYFTKYIEDGFTEFKFEVGAVEESGNQVFSEGSFEVADG